MVNTAASAMLLALAARCVSSETWCYYCNWTSPTDVLSCKDMSAQCIRCNDPLVACIGKSCFRYVARNGRHTNSILARACQMKKNELENMQRVQTSVKANRACRCQRLSHILAFLAVSFPTPVITEFHIAVNSTAYVQIPSQC